MEFDILNEFLTSTVYDLFTKTLTTPIEQIKYSEAPKHKTIQKLTYSSMLECEQCSEPKMYKCM